MIMPPNPIYITFNQSIMLGTNLGVIQNPILHHITTRF